MSPDSPSSFKLSDELDQALSAMWRGDSAALEVLIGSCGGDEDDEGRGPVVGPLLGDALRDATVRLSRPASAHWMPEIPGFEIERELGRGGMGVVYEARQLHPARKVAVKVIAPGRAGDHRHRLMFEREIRALAALDHPSIAHLYGAGATPDGRAYFVMELVRGESIIDYARSHRLTRQSLLLLFAQLCDAVHHAHVRGVIHRDLKPSNILVHDLESCALSDEAPQACRRKAQDAIKILDFGLARLTDDSTPLEVTLVEDAGQIKGTFAYMSPEQRRGQSDRIDARSDVYALGVVLYQLLTNRLPVDVMGKPLVQALRELDERDPPAMSRFDRTLRGDLDVIASTAMALTPQGRYQSAAQLADDIRRHLRHEPIIARPATAMYQLRKFAHRNKALVLGVSLTLAMLVLGLTGATLALMQTRAAQAETQQARRDVEQINAFLTQMLASTNPQELRGRNFSVQDMLDIAVLTLDNGWLADQPSAEAQVRRTLGQTYQSLGLYQQAQVQFEEGLRLARRAASADASLHALAGDLAINLAGVHITQEQWIEAEARTAEALMIQRTHMPEDHVAMRRVQRMRARVLEVTNRRQEGLALRVALLDEAISESDSQETAEIAALQLELARAIDKPEDPPRVEELFRAALATYRKLYGDEDDRVALVLVNLGAALSNYGQYDEADALFSEAMAIRTKLYGEEHPGIASVLYNLGYLRSLQKRYAEAEHMFRQSLAIRERHLVPGHYLIGRSEYRLGRTLVRLHRYEEAEPYYRAALENWRQHLPVLPKRGSHLFLGVATCLIERRQYAEAEPYLLEMHELILTHEPTVSWKRTVFTRLVQLYEQWGRHEQADEWRARLAQLESHPLPLD